jgi:hypothetical protein
VYAPKDDKVRAGLTGFELVSLNVHGSLLLDQVLNFLSEEIIIKADFYEGSCGRGKDL